MHVTLKPTIAWFLKAFDFFAFWTKTITSLIRWFVLNGRTVMFMALLQHLFRDVWRQHKDSPGDVFKSDTVTRGNDTETESCNQNQCSGPILKKKFYSYLISTYLQKFQSISSHCFFVFLCFIVFFFCILIMIIFFFHIDFDMRYMHDLSMPMYWKCVEIR